MATKAEVEQWKGILRKQLEVGRHVRAKAEEAMRIAVEAERNKQIASAISDGLQWRVDELENENAKLRELVADMWFWSYEGHIDSESQERQMLHIDAVVHRMRELGIEVDE